MSPLDAGSAGAPTLSPDDAAAYAHWFAGLGDPTQVRLLHTVATAPGGITVGALAAKAEISQSTCSHHVRKLADVGFVVLTKHGTTTRVRVNQACCARLPHAAEAVMSTLAAATHFPSPPADVTVRKLTDDDWDDVRRVYAEGIASGNATFETEVPDRRALVHRQVSAADADERL